MRELRTLRSFGAIGIALLACGAIGLLAKRETRKWGIALVFTSWAAWGVWSFYAPPQPMTQQMFGMTSPSTDGAFVFEAMIAPSTGEYLRGFDRTLSRSVQEMRGTRVLSNPPGMSVVARWIADCPIGRESLEEWLVRVQQIEPLDVHRVGTALRVGMVLCAIWALAGMVMFGLGREFLSPAGAAVFSVLVTFNPCAVSFVPGKDPGQLLTIGLMLWALLAGWKRKSLPLVALGGALLAIGLSFSLVHLWVAAIAFAAVCWDERKLLWWEMTASAFGAVVIVGLVYMIFGWNMPMTLIAVSRRWGEIQKTFEMSRLIWFLIGLPIFLLFLAPGIYALGALSLRRRRLNFGTRLALCTLGAMAFIYVVIGLTYELPRLWVAFLPTLVLGLSIDRPLLRGNATTFRRRVAVALILIIAAQVSFTAMHWTLFDVRELEFRLVSQRFYN